MNTKESSKIVVYAPFGIFSSESEVIHSSILERLESTDSNIEVIHCGGGFSCVVNPYSSRLICNGCKKRNNRFKNIINNYDDERVSFREIYPEKNDFPLSYISLEEYKEITYIGVDVGYSAFSTYVTVTRDFEPDIEHKANIKLLNSLVVSSMDLACQFNEIIDENVIEVVLFNGRLNNSRPLYRIARQKNIETVTYEMAGIDDRVITFSNAMPHDISLNEDYIEDIYNKYLCKSAEIADSFYHAKSRGESVNDITYVKEQKENLIPQYPEDNCNIVIFTSSEDEFKAIGGEWNDGLFKEQLDGINYIIDFLENIEKFNLFIRIHPNVKGAAQKYKDKVQLLGKSRVYLFDENSKVASYELLKIADKVITFGSTIGIEAAYQKKPSILLGRCFYESLGSTYNPRTLDELERYILSDNLKPKSTEGAIKYATFLKKSGYKSKYIKGDLLSGYTLSGCRVELNFFYKLSVVLGKAIRNLRNLQLK